MLDWTWNSVGHGRETSWDRTRAIRGEMGNYHPTWMTCDRVSYYTWLPMNVWYDDVHVSFQ